MAILDVIRCEQVGDWILWRWQPSSGSPQVRQHAIRFGSRLFVRPGQGAVFIYKGRQGDFIVGPFDGMLKTANLPVLANVIGLAFGGDTPFTAEVYFLNLQSALKMQWGVPFFPVMDDDYDIPVPVAVTGSCALSLRDPVSFAFRVAGGAPSYNASDISAFFRDKIAEIVKETIRQISERENMHPLKLPVQVAEVSRSIEAAVASSLGEFGVDIGTFAVSAVNVDDYDEGVALLKQQRNREKAQLRIRKKEGAVELENINEHSTAYRTKRQFDVLETGAGNTGQAGSGGSIQANMMQAGIGVALGKEMLHATDSMLKQQSFPLAGATAGPAVPPTTPPPLPATFHVAIGGQQLGPFDVPTIRTYVEQRRIEPQTLVWQPGMAQWVAASAVPELSVLFASPVTSPIVPPPLPPST